MMTGCGAVDVDVNFSVLSMRGTKNRRMMEKKVMKKRVRRRGIVGFVGFVGFVGHMIAE